MPSPVSDLMNVYSQSSFDTWSVSRGEEEDASSTISPVRYVKEGEYDTQFSAEEARRYYGNKQRRRQRQAEVSFSDASEGLFSTDFSSIDEDGHTRGSLNTRSTNNLDETYTRSSVHTRNLDDTFSYSLSTGKTTYQSSRSGWESFQSSRRPRTQRSDDVSSIDGSSADGHGYATDSLAEVLDKSFETQLTINTGRNLPSVLETANEDRHSHASSGEQSLQRGNRQQEERASPATTPESDSSENNRSWLPWSPKEQDITPTITNTHISLDQSTTDSAASGGASTVNLALHDLCGEATSPDDVAWHNALYLLSIQPQLAALADKGGWTPLHVCCLGNLPPPDFMVRALLLCNPSIARTVDKGGRLPLHIVAASSADPVTMKLLVDEYPQAVFKTDKRGYTPLQMFLKNEELDLTMERVRLLMGHAGPKLRIESKERILQRRGEHLNMTLSEVSRLAEHRRNANSALESLDVNDGGSREESFIDHYPDDVKVCLRKIDQWKRKLRRIRQEPEDSVEVELATSAEDVETNPAAIAAPGSLQYPLHVAVRREFDDENPFHDGYDVRIPPANRTEVLRVIIAACPDALVARDIEGRTPLMTVLLNQEALPSLGVLQLLLGMYTPGYDSPPSWAGDLPLHRARNGKYINPAMVPTLDTNQLPLHVAAEEMPSDISAVSAIQSSYPGAVNAQDVRGRTPLHMALRNYQRVQPCPEVVSLLLTDSVAQIRDDDGLLPFDLLVGGVQNLPWKEPISSTWSNRGHGLGEVYKKFFTSVVMQSPQPRHRLESMAFLRRLKNLPPWLRRQACSADFVQRLLIEEVSSLFLCFLILSYGALLAAVIVSFRFQMDEYTSKVKINSVWAPIIYGICSVVLLCQVCRWRAAASLSVFTSQCALNLWAWLDLVSTVFAIATTAVINREGSDLDLIAALGTATTGMLWCNVVGYVARSCHGMAVFMGGSIRIASLLFWPLIVILTLVVGFAQMFYTLNLTTSQDTCFESLAGQPLCNIRDSYIVVYHLLLGAPLVDTSDDETLSSGSILLIVIFTVLLVVLIVNIIVSVVLEASNMNVDEVALASYWEPTMNFVYMTWEWTTCSLCRRQGRQSEQRKNGDDTPMKPSLVYQPTSGERFSLFLERSWDVIVLAVQGGEDGARGKMWYVGCCTTNRAPHIIWSVRIAGLIVAPMWIALGVATCGLLLPPQIRRWLFRPRLRSCTDSAANAAAAYSAHQMAGMRNELLNLKKMSYEKTDDVQRDIRELKELLYAAMDEE